MAAKRLNQSPEGLMEMLEEHIVYEMRMLRATYMLLVMPGPGAILNPVIMNALIESFCGHARLLHEFFGCNTSPAAEEVCACHFTNGYRPFERERVPDRLRGKLNAQISHLSYNRTKQVERKFGPEDREQLFRILENEIEAFGAHLRELYRARWPADLTQRVGPAAPPPDPGAVLHVFGSPSATNVIGEVRSGDYGDQFGSAGPRVVITGGHEKGTGTADKKDKNDGKP